MTAVDPDTFAIAFSTEETRVVKQGRFQFAGQWWTSPEIVTLQQDEVVVRAPKYESDWHRLPIFSAAGDLLGFAEPDTAYDFLDPAGAVEANSRRKAHRRAVTALGRSAPVVDPLAERLNYLAHQLDAPTPPVSATIGAAAEAKAIAAGLRETSEQRATRRQREIERERQIRLELFAKANSGGR
jgi:hypothetical protein